MRVKVTNTHHAPRSWLHFTDLLTGTTLHLEPHESAEIDVHEGFESADPHLCVEPTAQVPVSPPSVQEAEPEPDVEPDDPTPENAPTEEV